MFTDLDFADDVSLFAELLELLVLEIFHEEATPLGLEVNWQKTIVQALGSTKDEPPSLYVCRHDVQRVESFVYLGAMIHSSFSSDPESHRRCAMIMLDKSECWVINKVDLQRIDSLDQWCL